MSSKTFVVHCKKEDFDVYIGRGSEWGNPFTHLPLERTTAKFQVATREEAIIEYEKWLCAQPELLSRVKKELINKRLGCFCAPLRCHGDILARIANEEELCSGGCNNSGWLSGDDEGFVCDVCDRACCCKNGKDPKCLVHQD